MHGNQGRSSSGADVVSTLLREGTSTSGQPLCSCSAGLANPTLSYGSMSDSPAQRTRVGDLTRSLHWQRTLPLLHLPATRPLQIQPNPTQAPDSDAHKPVTRSWLLTVRPTPSNTSYDRPAGTLPPRISWEGEGRRPCGVRGLPPPPAAAAFTASSQLRQPVEAPGAPYVSASLRLAKRFRATQDHNMHRQGRGTCDGSKL